MPSFFEKKSIKYRFALLCPGGAGISTLSMSFSNYLYLMVRAFGLTNTFNKVAVIKRHALYTLAHRGVYLKTLHIIPLQK